MLKHGVLMMFLTTIVACSGVVNHRQVDDNRPATKILNVSQAIALAIKNQDYRLWVTATRGSAVPGLEVNDFEVAMTLCGSQYMANTGDVINTEQARQQRKQTLIYMQQYNEKMWPICRAEKAD